MDRLEKCLHREAELQRRFLKWHSRLQVNRFWRFVKAVGYALSFIFCPRDNHEAGVKLGKLEGVE